MDALTLSNQTLGPSQPPQGFLRSINLSDSKTTARVVILLLPFPFLIHYLIGLALFHHAHLRPKPNQVPPTFPHLIPLLGSAIPFAFDCANFIRRATQYANTLVPVRLSLLASSIFLFQGPRTVAAVWKEPRLGSPILIYTFALQHVFGMPARALAAYRADDSGSHRRPHPASRVEERNRVDYLTHQILFRAFGGKGLQTAVERCVGILGRELDAVMGTGDGDGEGWVEMGDLAGFVQMVLGRAVLEGLYGPALGRLSPGFLGDLWAFDRATPKFAKLMPRWLMPEAYRVRGRLLDGIRRWHDYARQHFDESAVGEDGDADPYWGSEMVRSRQKVLMEVDGQDYEALAAADLGLIWASVTNVVPSTLMTALHIFRNPALTTRLRSLLFSSGTVSQETLLPDLTTLLHSTPPLLSSIYAETLRLHLQAYVTRSSPHADVTVGGWTLPRGKVCMVNTYAAHMDESVWNTRRGRHPVGRFWEERFLVYPGDPSSGPLRHDGEKAPGRVEEKAETANGEPTFSLQGLEGAWIPYGGGYAACPGRHFAKRIILYTTALLVGGYNIEILTDRLEMDDSCFGLGTQKPKHEVPFRIRRRREGGLH